MPSVSDFSRDAAETLTRLGARPVIAGALAAMRYPDTPRLATDAGFLTCDVPGIAEAFRACGYSVEVASDGEERPFMYAIRGADVRIDTLIAETEHQVCALERAVDGFLTPEDVIVHKPFARRPRDQDDIRSILRAGLDLDVECIAGWDAEREVADRWDEIRSAR